MQKVLFDISMSLDGLITEPNEGSRHPLGEDPGRLHDWMFDRRTEADSEVLDECHAGTGAVVMGKRTYMFASDGIEAALEQARAAAGEKNVGIWGHEPNAATDLRFRTTYES
jgi:hypothetical protein